ncbi:hypothetical protein TVVG_00052 [Tetraselmis viridis virus SI1]|uniref:hypothetical protein n=1 Tax=Tetraselmis viridis virus S20 TaxID=754070 RepID=UPI0002C15725|nr:hypothetical protein TVGG_00018 [Tetraselmis viridis virus S20]AGH31346.1 hypothetical protein TVGG_00018 [Tetraselmis viridis virus S20]AGH31434.1 hypothetical protein TVVG_00052 [Tetraselmis viridis virus SI1]
MAKPVDFNGRNILLRGNPEAGVSDMYAFRDEKAQSWWSCWKLTPEELEEVKRTGKVWLGVLSAGAPPPIMCSGHAMAPQAIEAHADTLDENGQPTRISSMPNDPGFIHFVNLAAQGIGYLIKLDDVVHEHVITADAVEGFIEVSTRNDDFGRAILDTSADQNGRPVTTRLEGAVTIEFFRKRKGGTP